MPIAISVSDFARKSLATPSISVSSASVTMEAGSSQPRKSLPAPLPETRVSFAYSVRRLHAETISGVTSGAR